MYPLWCYSACQTANLLLRNKVECSTVLVYEYVPQGQANVQTCKIQTKGQLPDLQLTISRKILLKFKQKNQLWISKQPCWIVASSVNQWQVVWNTCFQQTTLIVYPPPHTHTVHLPVTHRCTIVHGAITSSHDRAYHTANGTPYKPSLLRDALATSHIYQRYPHECCIRWQISKATIEHKMNVNHIASATALLVPTSRPLALILDRASVAGCSLVISTTVLFNVNFMVNHKGIHSNLEPQKNKHIFKLVHFDLIYRYIQFSWKLHTEPQCQYGTLHNTAVDSWALEMYTICQSYTMYTVCTPTLHMSSNMFKSRCIALTHTMKLHYIYIIYSTVHVMY